MTTLAVPIFRTRAWPRVNLGIPDVAAIASIAAMLAFFGWWYGRFLFDLPIFGDATIHAKLSREFLEGDFFSAESNYPPLYHALGAIAMALGGEQGFIALTFVSMLGLGVAVYVLSVEVTGSRAVGVVAASLAFISPKTAFYGGRLYMEVFLALLFVLAFYFLHRYIRKSHRSDLLACAAVSALAAITKQQGFLLLAAPLALFLPALAVIRARSAGRPWSRVEVLAAPVLLALAVTPSLLWQIRNTGAFLPESDYTSGMNAIARSLVGYDDEPGWLDDWDDYLDYRFVDAGYYALGSEQAERRHVWPVQAVTTEHGFFSIHSLLWSDLPGGVPLPRVEALGICGLFLAGFVGFLLTHKRREFTLFLTLFLLLNYVTFVRNNDQARYHLYIAYCLAFVLPWAVYAGLARIAPPLRVLGVLCLGVFLAAFAFRYLPDRTEAMTFYARSQAYAPSAGGMASIDETTDFIDAHSEAGDSFYAIPDNEFAYSSSREVIFDYRIYFLAAEQLHAVFKDMGVSYVVVPESATLPDEEWSHLFKAPRSFLEKVARLYPLVFQPSAGDIHVFKVQ